MTSLREGLMLEDGGIVSLVGGGGKTSLMFKLARELSAAGDAVLTTTTTKIFKPTADQTGSLILSGSVSKALKQAEELLNKYSHITAVAGRLPESDKLIGFEPGIVEEFWDSGLFQWIIVEADGAAGRPLKAPAAHEPVIPDCTQRLVGMVGLDAVGQPLNNRLVFRPELFARLTGIQQGSIITETAIADVLTCENGLFRGLSRRVTRIGFLNQVDVKGNFAAGRRVARILDQRKNVDLNRVVIGQVLYDPPVLETYDLDDGPG
jgi:probable selenium-dependent hydroxylase accessory protein YqeC